MPIGFETKRSVIVRELEQRQHECESILKIVRNPEVAIQLNSEKANMKVFEQHGVRFLYID
jgi:hypothetical protein